MTPEEHVAQLCKQVNEELEQIIPTVKKLPMEVSSRVLYSQKVGPIQMGYEAEYMNGDFDNIIEQYMTEISNKFHNHFVQLGLRPKETFEEYMGTKFALEPKPEYEKLLEQVDFYTKDFERVKRRFESDLASVPETIRLTELARRQHQISEIWDSIKNKEYQITKEDKQYAKAYTKRHNEYWDMWKD